ncbi:hypothetical protein IW261DRAFT_1566300 [Armillaria novae-zelandiae]|uniref:Peptidase S1 domain-containing protein n=1 Tax=Armillaria novae-zelandiae TaxID=153914 RepID=A0AA39P4Y9_9AGAR|nr:hypothetical protein IW261DRAFT_1566300 [Armillaria novae-zelandiae]
MDVEFFSSCLAVAQQESMGSPVSSTTKDLPEDTPCLPRGVSSGTRALHLCEGGQSDRVFLLTTCHVVFPPSAHRNKLYERKKSSQRRHKVLILGSEAYSDALKDMMVKIGREIIFVDHYKRELAALGEDAEARQEFQSKLTKAEKSITAVDKFHSDITKHWSTMNQRALGYLVHSPPISIDWNSFKGNAVHLGNEISAAEFVLKMHSHPKGRSSFKYPIGGLLQVQGIPKEEEIRHPTLLDANSEECLIVIKNGKSIGVTIGRGTGIASFVREYLEDGIKSTSMAVAIHPYSHKDGAFSAPEDSGSVVVDGHGRIVGLLIGGSGTTNSTDVTYLTPYFWIEEQIKKAFPNSYLYALKE